MSISIWLTFDNPDTRYLRNLIENLSADYCAPAFPPHITVYSALPEWNDHFNEKMTAEISGQLPFIVQKKNLAESDHFWKTLYIQLDLTLELKILYGKLHRFFSPRYDYTFDPHISLLYKKSKRTCRWAIIDKLEDDIKSSFRVAALTVVDTTGEIEEWNKLAEYRLASL